jgi:hypothetical protein
VEQSAIRVLDHLVVAGVPAPIPVDLQRPPPVGHLRLKPPSAPIHPTAGRSDAVQRVMVVDLDMPFGSMVLFVIKWTRASIPTILIIRLLLGLPFGIAALVLGGRRADFQLTPGSAYCLPRQRPATSVAAPSSGPVLERLVVADEINRRLRSPRARLHPGHPEVDRRAGVDPQ